MKPMLASDWNRNTLRFPVVAMPKIDGVRALNMQGKLTGRSLKPHANRYTTALYSIPELIGFDGEMAAESEVHPRLCSLTSSALSRVNESPFTLWWLFDYVTEETKDLPYLERLLRLSNRISELRRDHGDNPAISSLRQVSHRLCATLEELEHYDSQWLEQGYEGTIVRDPQAKHKQGRSTRKEQGLLRIKRFVEEEAEVLSITEGQTNQNNAQVNELGLQFRTSHKDNMRPNGRVGSMECRNLKDNRIVTVGAGRMTDEERLHFFKNPALLVGNIIKYQHFPKGVKDKPRFPTFQAIRSPVDM